MAFSEEIRYFSRRAGDNLPASLRSPVRIHLRQIFDPKVWLGIPETESVRPRVRLIGDLALPVFDTINLEGAGKMGLIASRGGLNFCLENHMIEFPKYSVTSKFRAF